MVVGTYFAPVFCGVHLLIDNQRNRVFIKDGIPRMAPASHPLKKFSSNSALVVTH